MALALAASAPDTLAQAARAVADGGIIVERIRVHGAALEGNLEGDSPDRDVIVYLPPGYERDRSKRYPVLYALHGYSIGNEKWTTEIKTPATIAGAYAAGAREMIVVLPNAQTVHNGSMYSNSMTTGDWEDFIAHDLVAYIDGHYRTIAARESRGLAGHSMGGYGTIRIGFKHPEVFSSLYVMSPCCLSARTAPSPEMARTLENYKSVDETLQGDFLTRATLAAAAAWSPNPDNPPFYFDLPTREGQVQSSVIARWAANAPLAMMHQYVPALRQYKAIALDVGDQDTLRTDTAALHAQLDAYKIANSFEIYPGTHVSAVADRFQNHVIPFFSRNLNFGP